MVNIGLVSEVNIREVNEKYTKTNKKKFYCKKKLIF